MFSVMAAWFFIVRIRVSGEGMREGGEGGEKGGGRRRRREGEEERERERHFHTAIVTGPVDLPAIPADTMISGTLIE